jgi:hypothetical protein
MEIVAAPADLEHTPDIIPATATSKVFPDGTFEIKGVVGPVRLRLGQAPKGWWVKSLLTPAEQLADAVLTTASEVTVVLSNAAGTLSGRVTTAAGQRAGIKNVVVVFPADESRWSLSALRMPMVTSEGRFELSLPPGDYSVAAVEEAQMMGDTVDALMVTLSPSARRVTITAGARVGIDLAPVTLP